jgi:putative ABC transport system permease protein
MRPVLDDFRHATRRLGATPAFAMTAVLTLALGLGASTAIFTALNTLLLRPLPYPEPERLVFIWGHRDTAPQLPVSLPVALDVAQRTRSFVGVEAWTSLPDTQFSLTAAGEPIDVQYAVVSAGLFPLLGGQPVRGRLFGAADDRLGSPQVAILSERLWRDRFASSGDLVGRAIVLDGAPYTVVGVLADSFRFVEYPRAPAIWLPLGSDPFRDRRFAPVATMGVAARLRPGVSLETARTELAQLARAIGREFPPLRNWTLTAEPFQTQLTGDRRGLLFALFGASGLLLLIACANIAGLLLVRATARERELAVRVALGASPARLARLLMSEALVLAFAGGAGGLLVAAWAADVLTLLAAGDRSVFAPWRVVSSDLRLNSMVFAFALVASTLSGLLAGLAPALHAARRRSLNSAPHTTIARHRARSVLVGVQVTLSLALLTGAGLLARSFSVLIAVNPGFTPSHALAVDLALPAETYAQPERIAEFYSALVARVSALPGVIAAGASDRVPLTGPPPSSDLRIEGEPAPEPGREPRAEYAVVTPGWFKAAGVRVLRGRAVMPNDDSDATAVTLINEAMARAYFPGRDPLGQRVALSNEAVRFVAPDRAPVLDFPSAYRTVVGVVNDIRPELQVPGRPAMYVPLAQRPGRRMTLVLRAAGDPRTLSGAVRRAVRELDSVQPIAQVRLLTDVVDAATEQSRFRAQLTAAVGLVGLVLAALGVYSVVAYAVAQRTREIGLRIALGARATDIVRLSARQGLRPVVIGALAGVPVSALVAVAIRGLLFGVAPFDPVAFLLAAMALLGVTAIACWVPARRALRVNPVQTLRAE